MIDGPSLVAALRRHDVTHVVWIPDSTTGAWEPALAAAGTPALVRACREGEAVALAVGLWLGGARPVVVMQSTGFFEAGDALRNALYDLGAPLFLVVGARSWKAHAAGRSADTCPRFTLPLLAAWGLPHTLLDDASTADDLGAEYAAAHAAGRPHCPARGVTAMMTVHEALPPLARHRGDKVVVTTMSAVGIWPGLSDTPLDFAFLPSSMGQAPALGLGLALAQPGRGVIVVNGDGCMLMNLGCLVTLAAHPADVYLVILDNGQYEVTGGQPTAGAGRVDFAQLARGAGFARVRAFSSAADWEAGAAEALTGPGPVAIWLRIEPRPAQKTPAAPRPMAEQIARLRGALGVPTRG